jgi:adenosylcobinamide-phosphate synthase
VGLLVGVAADRLLADPRRGHPVAGFGIAAGALEHRMRRHSVGAGAGFAAVCVGVPVVLGLAAERLTAGSPAALAGLTALGTWAVLGGESLAREGQAMADLLGAGDVSAARERLSHLCARDATGAEPAELVRATVESVAENTGDAVVGPLCWGVLAGLPGLLGYRAVNTLDAMVGYRDERYLRFGRAAARTDDVVNLIPARVTGLLTVAVAAAVGGSPISTARVLWADRRAHPSPNAGWCEAAAAGALGVALGGTNTYRGHAETRPRLGGAGREPEVADIGRAVRLSRAVTVAALAAAILSARRPSRCRRPFGSIGSVASAGARR